jgi:D-serine deaminase-like pyridoxal phosphate-dependent protein
MKTNRRQFLRVGAFASAAISLRSTLVAAESAAAGRTKAELPTPALLVDLDLLDANLKVMAAHCRQAGCGFRPHAKTHKCPDVAKKQIASGALGISVATVPEAEAMVAAGIRGVLLTSPIVEPRKIERMVALAASGGDVMLSAGHEREVQLLADLAAKRGVTINVLVDVDVGDKRTGALPGEPALELARLIGKHRSLRLRGLQAYAGHASHVTGFEKRKEVSRTSMAKAAETRELLKKAGFDTAIFSGGSTGTYNIDAPGIVTELQVGSYVFMDVNYRVIGGKASEVYTDFQPSLTVLTSVVSTSHSDLVTVDAGIKAFSTDTVDIAEAKGWPGLAYKRRGDEFGAVTVTGDATLPRLGDRIEFIVPHCDPTVNLYDRIYATRGDRVEAIWPIAARRELSVRG